MNGKRGVATDFHSYPADRTKDRYSVQLDSGEACKVKPANVRAEGAGRAPRMRGAGIRGHTRAHSHELDPRTGHK